MPATALLCVDSDDNKAYDASGYRIDDRTPANVYINKQAPLLFGYMTRLSLTETDMQWDIKNVNSTNNTLTVAMFSTGYNWERTARITIPVGWYTAMELAKAVQTQLNLDCSGGNWSPPSAVPLQYTVKVGGLGITGPSGETLTTCQPYFEIRQTATSGGDYVGYIGFVPYDAGTNNKYTEDISGSGNYWPPLTDDLTQMMGFSTPYSDLPDPTADGQVFGSRLLGSFASMQYTPYVDIVSNIITKNQNVADATSRPISYPGILARVYFENEHIVSRQITATYDASGDLVDSTDNAIGVCPFSFRREFRNPKVIQWNTTENVDVIDLKVIDYRGNPVAIDNRLTVAPDPASPKEIEVFITNVANFRFTIQATET